MAGLWYADNKTTRDFTRGVQNVLTAVGGSNPTSPTGYEGMIHTNNQAIFGQATYEFMPTYSILVGGRTGKETDGAYMNFYAPWVASSTSPTANLISPNSNQNATTGKVSLSHEFSKPSMAYILGSTGFKGRAYDLTSTTVSLAPGRAVPIFPGRAVIIRQLIINFTAIFCGRFGKGIPGHQISYGQGI